MAGRTPPTLPDLAGRCYVVTGGTGGLGYWASEQLAQAGATIVIAARTPAKGDAALASLAQHSSRTDARFVRLDLADLASVAEAADELAALPRIDGILANAGILSTHGRSTTADGFETMIGTNFLGHFALLGRLLPALETQTGRGVPGGARVVSLGSISHEFFRLDLDDLQATSGRFREFRTYGRSKLAVMTFAFELDRRLRAAGSSVSSLVAHPGFAVDQLAPHRDILPAPKRGNGLTRAGYSAIAQGKDAGAWPLAAALTSPDAAGGQYWGPSGWRQLKGGPTVVDAKTYARDPQIAAALWAQAGSLTGVSYP
ncbi:MAG: SDR family NAD(P)-dependent oxidoreductase [Herbiconiux sp.]|uniref:SDR family NAD(P)-dependent oxidoreductase n=1 Tax=Herbiconiux sp. TaxID=1871186 RepID=UPI001216A99B|nr:SDR family NAD(P)-dependent oxidoreductase [Herbiconiux sp.]TAJ49792.1 MAG: SDR family NAD(P)-dependent oxidoreductase [Herbiconiux sp.]